MIVFYMKIIILFLMSLIGFNLVYSSDLYVDYDSNVLVDTETFFYANFSNLNSSISPSFINLFKSLDIAVGSSDARFIKSIDLDRDGKKNEVLVGSGKNLYAFDSFGNELGGNWPITSNSNFKTIKIFDFDKDNFKDILVSDGNKIRVINSSGDIIFKSDGGSAIEIADIDSNSFMNIITSNSTEILIYSTINGISWSKLWSSDIVGNCVASIVVSDFDSDGIKNDIGIANGCFEDVKGRAYDSDGNLLWYTNDLGGNDAKGWDLSFTDSDSDGFEDDVILTYGVAGTLKVIEWDGVIGGVQIASDTINLDKVTGLSYTMNHIDRFDYNDDGVNEIITATNNIIYLLNQNLSEVWRFESSVNLGGIYSFSFFDHNGDGKLNIVAGGKSGVLSVLNLDGTLLIQTNLEQGSIGYSNNYDNYGKGSSIDFADLDNDGINEILTLSSDGFIDFLKLDNFCSVEIQGNSVEQMVWNDLKNLWEYSNSFSISGKYLINVSCDGNYVSAISDNFSIGVGLSAPKTTLFYPNNLDYIKRGTLFNISYGVTNTLDFVSCDLLIDDVIKDTQNNLNAVSNNSFSLSLDSSRDYLVKVSCLDLDNKIDTIKEITISVVDIVPVIFTQINAYASNMSSVIFIWETSLDSDSRVYFGEGNNLNLVSSNSSLSKLHYSLLDGLSTNVIYNYIYSSCNIFGDCFNSTIKNFMIANTNQMSIDSLVYNNMRNDFLNIDLNYFDEIILADNFENGKLIKSTQGGYKGWWTYGGNYISTNSLHGTSSFTRFSTGGSPGNNQALCGENPDNNFLTSLLNPELYCGGGDWNSGSGVRFWFGAGNNYNFVSSYFEKAKYNPVNRFCVEFEMDLGKSNYTELDTTQISNPNSAGLGLDKLRVGYGTYTSPYYDDDSTTDEERGGTFQREGTHFYHNVGAYVLKTLDHSYALNDNTFIFCMGDNPNGVRGAMRPTYGSNPLMTVVGDNENGETDAYSYINYVSRIYFDIASTSQTKYPNNVKITKAMMLYEKNDIFAMTGNGSILSTDIVNSGQVSYFPLTVYNNASKSREYMTFVSYKDVFPEVKKSKNDFKIYEDLNSNMILDLFEEVISNEFIPGETFNLSAYENLDLIIKTISNFAEYGATFRHGREFIQGHITFKELGRLRSASFSTRVWQANDISDISNKKELLAGVLRYQSNDTLYKVYAQWNQDKPNNGRLIRNSPDFIMAKFLMNGSYNLINSCTPNWSCNGWSSCVSGSQIRVCTDLNSCNNSTGKPVEMISCISDSPDGTSSSGSSGGEISPPKKKSSSSFIENIIDKTEELDDVCIPNFQFLSLSDCEYGKKTQVRTDLNGCISKKKIILKCDSSISTLDNLRLNYKEINLTKSIKSDRYYLANFSNNYYQGLILNKKPAKNKFIVRDESSGVEYFAIFDEQIGDSYYVSLLEVDTNSLEDILSEKIIEGELSSDDTSNKTWMVYLGIIGLIWIFIFIIFYIKKIHKSKESEFEV
jgi:hypothetical protein